MSDVVLNNVLVCTVPHGAAGAYVSNTGRIASVSDRVDLRRNAEILKGGSESVQLDPARIDSQNTGEVLPGQS